MLRALIAGLAVLMVAACASVPAAVTADLEARESAKILALLEAQDEAWNRGDIDGFMAGYWQSEDLRFASGGDVTRGYAGTLARYKARYSDRALMGTLKTTDHEIILLSPDAAVAHGRWQLTRDKDAPGGLYTLVLRKAEGDWVIISDTTTSAEE
ncbi:YybH family protein [Hyphomonas sp.]|uniref:YybH family protein n=1 Tax=Hyphomonas sp. TaxID=87 RepID=UPI003918B669